MAEGLYWSLATGEPSRVALALVQEGCFAALLAKRRRAESFLQRGEAFARRHHDTFALGGRSTAEGFAS